MEKNKTDHVINVETLKTIKNYLDEQFPKKPEDVYRHKAIKFVKLRAKEKARKKINAFKRK